MEAWMMKRTIGSLGLYLVGLRSSKIPAWAGGFAAAEAVAFAAADKTDDMMREFENELRLRVSDADDWDRAQLK